MIIDLITIKKTVSDRQRRNAMVQRFCSPRLVLAWAEQIYDGVMGNETKQKRIDGHEFGLIFFTAQLTI